MDRRWLLLSGVAVSLILCIVMINVSISLKKERSTLRAQQKELLSLKDEFLSLKGLVDSVEGKKSLIRVEGIVQAVDEVFKSVGLNRKVRSVKPLGTSEKKYAFEEEAEVQAEKLNMNELINLFFKIENAPMILSIRKTNIKTSFDNPSLLNITMTICFIKPK